MRRLSFRPWVTLCVALANLAPTVQAQQSFPQPPPGQGALASLALVRHSRDLCHGIAQKTLRQWRRYSGSSESQQEKIRDWVVAYQLSDLAAARAASDIFDALLPRARQDDGGETAAALDRLSDITRQLCDQVALPTAPRADFDIAVADLVDRMELEEEELGRLLVVPDEVLQESLEPYLTPIQLAGFEAESEYLDYLESQKVAPTGPTLQELMNAWYQRYTRATTSTKQALGQYLQARQGHNNRGMAEACREITGVVIPLLRKSEIFEIPIPQLPASKGFAMETLVPLERAYVEIRDMATDCNAGRSREVHAHLQEMQKHLNDAAIALSRFSLSP